jgi:hypothetical protein
LRHRERQRDQIARCVNSHRTVYPSAANAAGTPVFNFGERDEVIQPVLKS